MNWGTKVGGIEVAVTEALAERVASRGGILVDQVVTVSGRVFRARDGWVLEFCQDILHISLIGSTVRRSAELELFAYAGDDVPTSAELEAAEKADRERELVRSAAEFNAAFNHITDYEDAPTIVYVS
jgi:hypothetical protein